MKQYLHYSISIFLFLISGAALVPLHGYAGAPGTDDLTATDKYVKVNVYGGTNAYSSSEWNNWNVGTGQQSNKSINALKYSDGTISTVGALLSYSGAMVDNGSSYGSGMAPAGVLRYSSNATVARTFTISGLSASITYSLELYASRANTGYSSIFTIGSSTVTIVTDNNKTNKASFTGLTPNSSGQIVVSITSGATTNPTPNNYLNGFTLTEIGTGGTPSNQAPVANAGGDQTILLPTSSVSLNGSGTDADGTVAGYNWSQVSGPSQATISSAGSPATNVSGLGKGAYVFRFTVTDNLNATGFDEVTITVNSSTTSVFNPNDPVVTYSSANPPTKPASGKVGKWVRTPRVSWNTSSFKCYIYNNMAFRLKYPKNYDATKAYPIMVFFHGLGEYGVPDPATGNNYDNEFQLYLGGSAHNSAVDNGKFNGFLLYPQHTSEFWSSGNIANVTNLIEKVMVPENMVDPFRVYVNGLSAGGTTTWNFLGKYTKLVAAATPISSASSYLFDSAQKYKFTPLFHFQGQLDPEPSPADAKSLGNKILDIGGNYKYKEFANRGHDCWHQAWADPDYFPFYNRAHKANPWPLFGRTEFCAGDPIGITLGVTPGFEGYEWRRNGVLIPGATTNEITVNELGSYDCRIKRGTQWSVWSPIPVVLKLKPLTKQPAITIAGLASSVIPAPDGSTTVALQVPEGYATYNWQKEGSSTVLSTTPTLTASSPGNYKVQVTEKFGCGIDNSSGGGFSLPFPVVNANGTNGPDAVSALTATGVSKISMQLQWNQTASPAFQETGFEVYEAKASGGPYVFKALTAVNATGITLNNLNSGTEYFYKVRAVNNNAASAVVGPVSAATLEDRTAPTTPLNLRAGALSRSQIELLWNAATDDVGVVYYDIYVNGVKSYVYGKVTKGIVYNLVPNTSYTFTIKARDFAGNTSEFSNAVTAKTSTGYLKLDPSMTPSNPNNFSVYMNMNLENPATFPWNNTNVLPSEGNVFSNLRTYASNNSGAKMTIVENFSGYNPGGMNTGNNSGVYPDNVMRSMYYCGPGQVAKLKFTGLSLNHKYSFIFFGSRNGTGDRTGVYKIGEQQVSLNASLNTTNTVQLTNVVPDANGSVIVEVSLGPTAIFAYLNSIVIKGYYLNAPPTTKTTATAITAVTEESDNSTEVSAFPNPVLNDVTLRVPLSKAVPALLVKITDASGSVLSAQNFANVAQGIWQQRIPLNGNASQPGVYFIHITGLPEGKSQVLKIVKVK